MIYTHLTDLNVIKADLNYFTRRIMMVFSFVQTSLITLAGILFCHYTSYSVLLPQNKNKNKQKKEFSWQQKNAKCPLGQETIPNTDWDQNRRRTQKRINKIMFRSNMNIICILEVFW